MHLVSRYLLGLPKAFWQAPLIAALFIGGVPLLVPLTRKLFAREFGSDHLAGISVIVSGDRAEEVQYLAERVGIKEVHASSLDLMSSR